MNTIRGGLAAEPHFQQVDEWSALVGSVGMQRGGKSSCAHIIGNCLASLVEGPLLHVDFSRAAWEFQGRQRFTRFVLLEPVFAPNGQVKHIDGELKAVLPLHTIMVQVITPKITRAL